MATGVSAASASTLFVDGASGNDTNPCTSAAAPCKTIDAAVGKSQLILGTATIEVAAGTYKETLDLSSSADNGIAINGAGSEGSGTVIEGSAGKEPTFELDSPGITAVLSNLRVVAPSARKAPESRTPAIWLNNVFVDMRNPGKYEGIESEEIGALSIDGGGVTIESGRRVRSPPPECHSHSTEFSSPWPTEQRAQRLRQRSLRSR